MMGLILLFRFCYLLASIDLCKMSLLLLVKSRHKCIISLSPSVSSYYAPCSSIIVGAYCYWHLAFLSRVVVNADAPYIKMVSEQFDRCHGTLLQYVDFLCSAVTPTINYAKLIPPLEDLIHKYHLDPEVIQCTCHAQLFFKFMPFLLLLIFLDFPCFPLNFLNWHFN